MDRQLTFYKMDRVPSTEDRSGNGNIICQSKSYIIKEYNNIKECVYINHDDTYYCINLSHYFVLKNNMFLVFLQSTEFLVVIQSLMYFIVQQLLFIVFKLIISFWNPIYIVVKLYILSIPNASTWLWSHIIKIWSITINICLGIIYKLRFFNFDYDYWKWPQRNLS